MEGTDPFISANSFFVVLTLLICLLLGRVFRQYQISQHFPDPLVFVLVGMMVGVMISLIPSDSSESETRIARFNPQIFFFVVLPPIIFEAGYTLKRRAFFSQLGSILAYAIVGTLFTTIFFGYALYGIALAANGGVASQSGGGAIAISTMDALESLCMGSIISPTDTISTLSILASPAAAGADPLLHSLVFGESVLNDAISIVLFQTFASYMPASLPDPTPSNSTNTTTLSSSSSSSSSSPFDSQHMFKALGQFVGVSLGSFFIGVTIALMCSFLCKRVSFRNTPHLEFLIIFLFAFASYFLADTLSLSGIMSLFFAGVCLSHYNFYNISVSSRISTIQAARMLSTLCETICSCYVGIMVGLEIVVRDLQWNVSLIFLTLFLTFIARIVVIFPLTLLINLCRSPSHRIPLRVTMFLAYSGVRGAVSFALALQFPNGLQHSSYVITSVLVLVLFTNFAIGMTTLPLLKWTGNLVRPSHSSPLDLELPNTAELLPTSSPSPTPRSKSSSSSSASPSSSSSSSSSAASSSSSSGSRQRASSEIDEEHHPHVELTDEDEKENGRNGLSHTPNNNNSNGTAARIPHHGARHPRHNSRDVANLLMDEEMEGDEEGNNDNEDDDEDEFDVMPTTSSSSSSAPSSSPPLSPSLSSAARRPHYSQLAALFKRFDRRVMRRYFGGKPSRQRRRERERAAAQYAQLSAVEDARYERLQAATLAAQ